MDLMRYTDADAHDVRYVDAAGAERRTSDEERGAGGGAQYRDARAVVGLGLQPLGLPGGGG